MTGPLEGLRVVELAGLGPAPFCSMLLADYGADVVRIDRKGGNDPFGLKQDILNRGKRSIILDLKTNEGRDTALDLIEKGDVVIEGFRPGVMEKLGLGPDKCLQRNPKIIYGRMTGWGQDGPLSKVAGHDINYISLSGVLHAIGGRDGAPVLPLNMVGDFGGGALFLAVGILAALREAEVSGQGQVVDAAMTDGSALLMAMIYGFKQNGIWSDERGENILDGGAHFYSPYECSDGKWVSIGSIEPQFYKILLEKCKISDPSFLGQWERSRWPELKQKLAEVFKQKSRSYWCKVFEGTDVCFAPILNLEEAPEHPHNIARGTFVNKEGCIQPAPAPRFSRTPAEIKTPPPKLGEHHDEILHDWNIR